MAIGLSQPKVYLLFERTVYSAVVGRTRQLTERAIVITHAAGIRAYNYRSKRTNQLKHYLCGGNIYTSCPIKQSEILTSLWALQWMRTPSYSAS